jgi:hypothetical protein
VTARGYSIGASAPSCVDLAAALPRRDEAHPDVASPSWLDGEQPVDRNRREDAPLVEHGRGRSPRAARSGRLTVMPRRQQGQRGTVAQRVAATPHDPRCRRSIAVETDPARLEARRSVHRDVSAIGTKDASGAAICHRDA